METFLTPGAYDATIDAKKQTQYTMSVLLITQIED